MATKKNFAVFEEKIEARVKKNILKKNTGTRKALSAVTNSRRNQTSRKKPNEKLTAVNEEAFNEKDIEYEGFQHDHRKCIQAQHDDMDMDDFLKALGLGNGCPKELSYLKRPETPPPSPPRFLGMLEEPISDRSAKKFDFSPPESPDYQFWKYCEELHDYADFKLLDSPKH